MIYYLIFYHFFIIGLLSVGGGAATIPFLFDLLNKYKWFTVADLADMIAIAESLPGALGINIAVFTGFKIAGVLGSILAAIALILPSFGIIFLLIKLIDKFNCRAILNILLIPVQPVVLALITYAAYQIGLTDMDSLSVLGIFSAILALMFCFKASPIFYIFISGVLGVLFGL